MTNTNKLEFKEVPYSSDSYERSVQLRDRILRAPLGLQFSMEDLKKEVNDHHLVCLINDNIIGVVLMRPIDRHLIKMRQVAIDEAWQRKGIGSQLVEFAEKFSIANGFGRIEMHARDVAIPFYERLNYRTSGDWFTEVGIQHKVMWKEL